ncbi:hypothetical protein [Acetobacter conturbans]|uniref:hypothetical protein n=1 Tax=Acetobacter conturbans TaxID=1737472 RepID=UPI001569D17C|nr:hypothetical protein [Acetobacter conturbans]
MDISTIVSGNTPSVTGLTASTNAAQASASQTLTSTKASATATGLNAPPVVNPASHINPALGIVVVETYNSSGTVIDQYPTAHMLQQYTIYGLSSDPE